MENNTHPATLSIPRQERYSRWLALGTLLAFVPKLVLLIPHFVILYFLGILMLIVAVFAQIAVLVTGRYPENFFTFVQGAIQWQLRANLYLLGLTDSYPPFSLK